MKQRIVRQMTNTSKMFPKKEKYLLGPSAMSSRSSLTMKMKKRKTVG